MQKTEAEKYLYTAMAVGEAILEYGGEVSRVEDSIRRICLSFGLERADVFCITSTIITTVYWGGNESCTQTCRIRHTCNDFDRLAQVNDLSRTICRKQTEPDTALEKLKEIDLQKNKPLPVQMLIYTLVPASFTVFFGGNAADMLISGLIGAILLCLSRRLKDVRFNALFTALLCSLAGGFLAGILSFGTEGSHAALVSIGNVMVFIPGVKFTNSIRDLLTGETITGLICLAESLLLSIIVALGFAAPALIL